MNHSIDLFKLPT